MSNSVRPHRRQPTRLPVPGILQARTLEWVATSFSNAWKWKVKVKLLSRVRLLVTPWTAAYQAPLSMGFSRQEYWSGVPLPSYFYSLTWSLASQGSQCTMGIAESLCLGWERLENSSPLERIKLRPKPFVYIIQLWRQSWAMRRQGLGSGLAVFPFLCDLGQLNPSFCFLNLWSVCLVTHPCATLCDPNGL